MYFVPISLVNGAPVTFGNAIKEAATRRMKVTPDVVHQLRICSRLEGGGRDANLNLMSKALEADPAGKIKQQIQTAIELRLRALGFKECEDFTPAAT